MNGMIWTIAVVVFSSGFFGPQMNWIAQGNRALDAGNPRQAAAAFARGLEVRLRTGAPAEELLHLRVRLATALMEAGQDGQAEATLQEAGKSAALASGLARAELLNVWSALHLKRGQLSAAEGKLRDAWQIGRNRPRRETSLDQFVGQLHVCVHLDIAGQDRSLFGGFGLSQLNLARR